MGTMRRILVWIWFVMCPSKLVVHIIWRGWIRPYRSDDNTSRKLQRQREWSTVDEAEEEDKKTHGKRKRKVDKKNSFRIIEYIGSIAYTLVLFNNAKKGGTKNLFFFIKPKDVKPYSY